MEIKLSSRYEPLFELLENQHRQVDTVVITGGRNSQKSFATGLFSCVSTKDYAYNVLYTRYTLVSADDSIIPEFIEKIDLLDASDKFHVTKGRIEGYNNSKIVFKGIKTSAGNQTASLKSLKGFNLFILEEAEEMPDFDSWDKIKKSIRSKDKRNLSIIILNPTTSAHWIYDEFFESKGIQGGFNGVKDNVMYIHTTYLDLERNIIADEIFNDFEDKRLAYEEWLKLPDSEKEYSPLKKKATYYKYVILGGWLPKAEGVIFENWRLGEFVDTGYTRFGSDYGFANDPSTLIEVSVDSKAMKIYAKEHLYKAKLKTKDLADIYINICGYGNKIIADSAEPRLISELSEDYHLNIHGAIKGPDSIKMGIAKLLEYELIIDHSSLNLQKELNNYRWSDKKSETPVDAYNHLIDPLRYAISDLIDKPTQMTGTMAQLFGR